MKFSTVATLGSIFAIASAGSHIQEVAVICTDANPTTIFQTVTVTATATVYNCVGNQVTSSSSTLSVSTRSVSSSALTNSTRSMTTIPPPVMTSSSILTNSTRPATTIPPVSTSNTISAGSPKATHKVIVGADGNLIFGANQVNAAVGDIIRFDFNSTNHTVTQSSFNAPCSPLAGGFNTGFHQFNNQNKTGLIYVDFKVDTTSPLWFYCAQTNKVSHCHKGMVLGVNPAGKFPAFLSMATQTGTTSSMPLSTGGSKITTSTKSMGTGVSKPVSTVSGGFSVSPITLSPLSTGMRTGTGLPPKPTASQAAYRFKGRRAAEWYN